MTKFAERVTLLMKEKNLTQKDVSTLSKVSEASLCRYLKGAEPRMDIVMNVAKALGVTVNYLLGKSEERNAVDIVDVFEETKIVVARNKKSLTKEQRAELISILFDN